MCSFTFVHESFLDPFPRISLGVQFHIPQCTQEKQHMMCANEDEGFILVFVEFKCSVDTWLSNVVG